MRTRVDKMFVEEVNEILNYGYKDINPRAKYLDGTPAHTLSINHVFRKYDLSNNEFPILNLRPIPWKSAIKEILWIYQAQSNNLEMLNKRFNVHYWNDWESEQRPGTIGQRYGATVRRYHLIHNLIEDIEKNPYGRRKVMSLWQEKDLNETDGLSPCAFCTIWNVRGEFLDMALIQRSGDLIAASGPGGVNEVQYAALLMMIANHTGYKPGIFSHFVANEHIYDRHIKQAEELKSRYFTNNNCTCPYLVLCKNKSKNNFYDFTIDDFKMIGYEPTKPQLKFELGI